MFTAGWEKRSSILIVFLTEPDKPFGKPLPEGQQGMILLASISDFPVSSVDPDLGIASPTPHRFRFG
uniref:Uncharacterized protein n=1 Tax=Candidatus Kentrum sp. LFY TaxID=2126342 RepID=A0A450V603_9GAMM|nr:MAG: hypothetical protein BECKLFY1418B_GA0070995_11761 [Candidatus Kentron sp. LFY]